MRSEINMENSSNRLLVSFAQVPKIKWRECWCKINYQRIANWYYSCSLLSVMFWFCILQEKEEKFFKIGNNQLLL